MKSHEPLPWLRARRSHLGATALACAIAALVSAPVAQAKDGVRNLGGGLEQLAVPAVRAQAQSRQSLAAATAEEELTFTPSVQFDDAGRALVRISLDGKVPAATVLQSLQGHGRRRSHRFRPELSQRRDRSLRADRRAREPRRQARRARRRPVEPDGDQRRRNRQPGRRAAPRGQDPAGVDGSGITVGVMSDSYDTNAAPNSAAADIATGDLPGAGNPFGNTAAGRRARRTSPGGTDEGRAMLQIVHDMAPKARLGFATANGGRAQLRRTTSARSPDCRVRRNAVPGFKADVIVDDIIYPGRAVLPGRHRRAGSR